MSAYKLYRQGAAWIVERTQYPRLRGECTDFMTRKEGRPEAAEDEDAEIVGTLSAFSDITKVVLLDDCKSAALLAGAMREAGDFLAAEKRRLFP